jgi:hypothetical protein
MAQRTESLDVNSNPWCGDDLLQLIVTSIANPERACEAIVLQIFGVEDSAHLNLTFRVVPTNE